jgi:hypothetical protein
MGKDSFFYLHGSKTLMSFPVIRKQTFVGIFEGANVRF